MKYGEVFHIETKDLGGIILVAKMLECSWRPVMEQFGVEQYGECNNALLSQVLKIRVDF